MSARLVVVGDALLDRDVEGRVERLSPEGPIPVLEERTTTLRPGGAALAATLAASDGRPVTLVTALSSDGPGDELRDLLARAGVELCDLGLDGPTVEKIRFCCDGRVLLRVDRNGTLDNGPLRCTAAASAVLQSGGAVLVSDYGRGLTADEGLRGLLAAAARARPLVWDPHPRGADPVPGARLCTPNAAEAARLVPGVSDEADRLVMTAHRARRLAGSWSADAIVVTMGADGALLVAGDAPPVVSPAPPARGADACGAGDRFAACVAGLLGDGMLLTEAVHHAVQSASAFVAAGGATSVDLRSPRVSPKPDVDDEVDAVVACIRAQNGRLVATGGCFDLLHAGHVRMLEAARALGDGLVVLLNSDASVSRLKGGGRPVVGQEDRAALLLALGCVDGVLVFDERTPEAALERLRPDVFVKGGDYALADLPEAEVVARWGGETVILPYEEGRSTTRLLEEVLARAG